MPYKICDTCNVQVEPTGDSDSRSEWCKENYFCPKCKAQFTHRQDFDQNGLVISDTFERDPKDIVKEDAVREALGVEKKFEVHISIPTTGLVVMKMLTVMAVDVDEAEKKAKELIENGEADIKGDEPEEHEHDYDYAESSQWDVDVNWDA